MELNETNAIGDDSNNQLPIETYFQFYKYVAPIVIQTSLIGCLVLLFLLILYKDNIRYPSTTNLAICCLLLADIFYLILATLSYLGKAKIIPRRLRDINKHFCYGIIITLASAVYLQCYLQCIISMERLIAVMRPFKVKIWITKRRMVTILVFCAVASLTAAYLAMPVGFRYKNYTCEINPEKGVYMALLAVFTITTVPGIILVVCTIGIIKALLKTRHHTNQDSTVAARLKPSEVRLALMLVVIDIVFIIMGIPYTAFTFLVWIVGEITPSVKLAWDISMLFTSLGAFTDWIIIFALGSQIRTALMGCLRPSSRSSSRTSDRGPVEEMPKAKNTAGGRESHKKTRPKANNNSSVKEDSTAL